MRLRWLERIDGTRTLQSKEFGFSKWEDVRVDKEVVPSQPAKDEWHARCDVCGSDERRMIRSERKIVCVECLDCCQPRCCSSTGICDSLTFGGGDLSEHGYWSKPCARCARAAEKRDGVAVGTYWPHG